MDAKNEARRMSANGQPNTQLSLKQNSMKKTNKLREKYKQKLASLPPSGGGGCHTALLGVASIGVMGGLSQNEIFFDIRSAVHGTRFVPDREIRDAIKRACMDTVPFTDAESENIFQKRYRANTRTNRDTLRRLIKLGEGTSEKDIIGRSPIPINWKHEFAMPETLKHLYIGNELLFGGQKYDTGNIKKNILTVEKWIDEFYRNKIKPPEFLIPNPLSGQAEKKENGEGDTNRGNHCIKAFKFAVIEFDELPKAEQIAFWSAVQLPVCALIDSGNKSIHGWVKIDGIETLSDWKREVEQHLFRELLEPLGIDGACKNPARLSRCPGHFRRDKGRWQRALYLAPEGKAVSV